MSTDRCETGGCISIIDYPDTGIVGIKNSNGYILRVTRHDYNQWVAGIEAAYVKRMRVHGTAPTLADMTQGADRG